jgi:hypothetical protein
MQTRDVRRRSWVLAGMTAGFALALIAVPGAAAGGQALDEIKNAAEAPPVMGGGSPTSITPQEAYAAATEPGSTVEIARGLTLEQAVGMEASSGTASPTGMFVADAASVSCWRWAPWVRWGTWPWHQKVTNHFNWCAVYGDHITSWSSHVTLDAYLCGYNGAYGFKQVGGVGYGIVRDRAGGYFSCSTPYFITFHYNRWFDTSFYTRGSAAIVATS